MSEEEDLRQRHLAEMMRGAIPQITTSLNDILDGACVAQFALCRFVRPTRANLLNTDVVEADDSDVKITCFLVMEEEAVVIRAALMKTCYSKTRGEDIDPQEN